MSTLHLQSCDCRFDLHCANDHVAALIEGVFAALVAPPAIVVPAHREYVVDQSARGTYRVTSEGTAFEFADADALLFHIDKSITLALQNLRPDLLFVHGAVMARHGHVAILSAPPGTGKSTLTLVALQLGLEYFSDELAPIDLRDLSVHSYPRALYLKTPPPHPHRLPADVLDHGGRYHVTMAKRTASVTPRAALAVLLFLRRDAERFHGVRRLTPASASAYLVSNTLNLLAHESAGIDAVAAVCRAVDCFELDATDLTAAGEAIRAQLDRQIQA